MDEHIVIWLEPAVGDLQKIIDYITPSNPTAAIRTASDIIQRVEMLAVTPRMGKRYNEPGLGEVREIVSGKYRIFYLIHDDGRVEIMTIQHSSLGDPDLSRN